MSSLLWVIRRIREDTGEDKARYSIRKEYFDAVLIRKQELVVEEKGPYSVEKVAS